MKQKLILASSSPRRKELLETVGIIFKIVHPKTNEERILNETPTEFTLRISKEKALSVSEKVDKESTILSADTIVVIENKILGKPKDEYEAMKMLNMLSGKTHTVITAFTLVKPENKILHMEAVKTEIKIKNLAPREIEGYINTKEPMDKAGSYGIQGIGSFMVEEIKGSYTNVVGLPIAQVIKALQNLNLFKLF